MCERDSVGVDVIFRELLMRLSREIMRQVANKLLDDQMEMREGIRNGGQNCNV